MELVFIDIDNTLLDFDEYIRRTMQEGFAHFGLKPYEPYMEEIFHLENGKLWRQIEQGTLTFAELERIRWNNVFAALDIEKHYSKQEIFEMYVNTIYFGNGCYGVAEAAEGYFKTDAASLTDAQAVVLAGLPQAPSVYASSPALAHKRARVVLQRMVDCHKLTQDAAAQLSAETDVIPFITRSIA